MKINHPHTTTTTTSRYDLLGRRVELVHPDAGTTTMVYDKASNLIQRQTSQIRETTPNGFISYEYDYNRLQEIKYPSHPENNVRYHYGKQEESPSRRGRLWLVEDASGGAEYFYGDMGEVEKEIRTIRITPTETQTYVSEYSYDSWNRIQRMVYPDGEVLDFEYNRAGQLNRMTGKKGQYNYTYLKQQGYDEFEQKVYRHYGNDTETHYSYDPVMRRLSTLESHSDKQQFQNNHYSYDLVGNILKVENSVQVGNTLGGASVYQYQYDELNRLIKAEGSYTGFENKANYSLTMQYNNLNGIVQKALSHKLNDQEKGYTLNYEYNNANHPHAPSIIRDSTKPKARGYEYDGNGNPISYEGFKDFRLMVWDEENRLQGINDNGKLHLYTYDHTGERVLKSSNESQQIIINGVNSAIINHSENYTAYVSPYFVVNKGKFTKHYFEGSTRIASKLGEGTFQHPSGITAGSIDYIAQSAAQQEAIDNYIRTLKVPPGPPTQQGIFGSPEYTGVPYPSVEWQEISQDQEPPEGWPRSPKFNDPGDVPGPPVQYGDPQKPENAEGGLSFIDNGVEENNLYFYHPDHLGSSSYISNKQGDIIQHTEYMAFGEILFDEHSVSTTMPYLFNGKELDSETGLYYYGARYYDSKVSLWLGTDPLSGYNPIQEIEHYIDGQHNGGIFNPMNLATYSYTYQNPIKYIDPNGKQVDAIAPWMEIVHKEKGVNERDMNYGFKRVKEYYKIGAGQGGLHPINNAWCSSFANWVLITTNKTKQTQYSYIPPNGHTNNPALAINFVNKTRYPGGRVISSDKKPPYGAILIMQKKGSHEGHAGFVVNFKKNKDGVVIILLGGNQNHEVRYQSYEFKKKGDQLLYKSKYILKGFVVPKEYIFDENNEKYYKYEKISATDGNTR